MSLVDAIGRPGMARTRSERLLERAVVRIVRLRAGSTRRRVVVWNSMRRTLESDFSMREAIETAIDGAPRDKARMFMLRRWQFAYADGPGALAGEVARWVPASESMLLGALEEGNAQTVVAAAARVAEVTRTMTRAVRNALLMPGLTLLGTLAALWWAGGDLLPKFREMSDHEKWSNGAQLGYWLATNVREHDIAIGAGALALVVAGWIAVLRWTGAGRVAMDNYVPFSLYRVASGTAFLMMVVELMKLGVDLNDETWKRLSERASPYVRSRIEAIQERMVRGGMDVGRAMREAGTGFPDWELVAVAAAFDGRRGWHEEMSLFLERWVRDSEESVKLAAAGVTVFLLVMAVLLATLMLSPMFQSTIHLKNLGS